MTKPETGIEYYYLKSKTSAKPTMVFVRVPKVQLLKAGNIYKVRTGWIGFSNGFINLKNHNIACKEYPLLVYIDGKVVDTYTSWADPETVRKYWKEDEELYRRSDVAGARKRFGIHKFHFYKY